MKEFSLDLATIRTITHELELGNPVKVGTWTITPSAPHNELDLPPVHLRMEDGAIPGLAAEWDECDPNYAGLGLHWLEILVDFAE